MLFQRFEIRGKILDSNNTSKYEYWILKILILVKLKWQNSNVSNVSFLLRLWSEANDALMSGRFEGSSHPSVCTGNSSIVSSCRVSHVPSTLGAERVISDPRTPPLRSELLASALTVVRRSHMFIPSLTYSICSSPFASCAASLLKTVTRSFYRPLVSICCPKPSGGVSLILPAPLRWWRLRGTSRRTLMLALASPSA